MSYQRRVAHVKRCEPAIKKFPWSVAPCMHQGWQSLLQNSMFDDSYHLVLSAVVAQLRVQ